MNWRYECILNCPSFADDHVDKTLVDPTPSSPKVIDKLIEIRNTLMLLSTTPLSITTRKLDMVGAQEFQKDLPEPKTPAGDPHELLKARRTGIKVTYLFFLDFSFAFYIICIICEVIFLLDKTGNSGRRVFNVSKYR